MFEALRRRLVSEEGLTLVELTVAMIVAALIIGIMTVITGMIFRNNAMQELEFEALNEMRFAKAEMVREIRFATASLPVTTPNTIDLWIDRDDSGGSGPDQPGEQITWQIVGTDLIRYEDADATTFRVFVTDLVTSRSSIGVVDDVASIELTADSDTTRPPAPRTIKTQVNLRNL
jgi:Tfp pilus assembly protein FimT